MVLCADADCDSEMAVDGRGNILILSPRVRALGEDKC